MTQSKQLLEDLPMSKPLSVIDLFAGCGGLSLGLEEAGFTPVFVNELNDHALESYLINREADHPHLRDPAFHINNVKDLVTHPDLTKKLSAALKKVHGINTKKGELDLLVGGPPCQGYSGIGHRRSYSVDKKQLPSNHLYQDMAWLIRQLNPKVFLFENVRGLLSARWSSTGAKGEIWEDVLSTFKGIPGYRINYELVYAKNYGVPQNRPRVLLVGVREDIDISPWESLGSTVANGFLPPSQNKAPDLVDLLGDLVDDAFEYGGSTTTYPHKALTKTQKELRTSKDGKSVARKGQAVTEHDYSKHSDTVKAKFTYMIKHNGEIHESMKTKKFAQRLLPKEWDKSGPSITCTSLADDYVHFSQPRVLTVREWARLQGFPDWYQFAGKRTTGGIRRAGNPRDGVFDRELPKYTQIGNAVPVKLAKAIGEHFKLVLGDAK